MSEDNVKMKLLRIDNSQSNRIDHVKPNKELLLSQHDLSCLDSTNNFLLVYWTNIVEQVWH